MQAAKKTSSFQNQKQQLKERKQKPEYFLTPCSFAVIYRRYFTFQPAGSQASPRFLLREQGLNPRWQREQTLRKRKRLNFTLHFLAFLTEKQNHCMCPFVLVSKRMQRSYSLEETLKQIRKYLADPGQVSRLEPAVELQSPPPPLVPPLRLPQKPEVVVGRPRLQPPIHHLPPKFVDLAVVQYGDGGKSCSPYRLFLKLGLRLFGLGLFLLEGRWERGGMGVGVGRSLQGYGVLMGPLLGLVLVPGAVMGELVIGGVGGRWGEGLQVFLLLVQGLEALPLVVVFHLKLLISLGID